MRSILFASLPDGAEAVEARHEPCAFVRESGVYIAAAGSARLPVGGYALETPAHHVWLALEEGEASLLWHHNAALRLTADGTCFLPPGAGASLEVSAAARCLWVAFAGRLAPALVEEMGGLPGMPIPQRAMLRQLCTAKRIVGAVTRAGGSVGASYQLQQLLFGMLAAHWGCPAGEDGAVSREIRRVLDALLSDQLPGDPTLSAMAELARMPTETFRKRFVAEVGLPPLRFALYVKMERAKALLREPGSRVSDVGALLGFHDPYRFSRQFKSMVGISPSQFAQLAAPQGANRVAEKGVTPPRANFEV